VTDIGHARLQWRCPSVVRLQLNVEKTEVVWFVTTTLLNWLRAEDKRVTDRQAVVEPSTAVRALGVVFDAELSMRDRITRMA
jgi:hypothetical protein